LLAPELALVHAQSETLSSFDQAQQRLLLDRFAHLESHAVADAYHHWQSAARKLAEMEQGEQDRLRMADLWSYQRKEIEQAQLVAEEDVEFEAEKRVLVNSEKLYAAAIGAYEHLYDRSDSAESTLRAAQKNIEELARYDAKFGDAVQQLASARAIVDDLSGTLRDYAESLNASPDRLAEIEDRLAVLDRLKRKYGSTVAEILAFGEDVAQKLAEIEDRDEILKQLQVELAQARTVYEAAAEALSRQRQGAAGALAKLAERQINDLAMKVRFEVSVTPQLQDSAWSAHGWDLVEYRIATNAGEPLKPLDEIASGGEMSRVMLALKVSVEEGLGSKAKPVRAAANRTVSPRTLVFDEIDIGIGGRAAEAVGHKLKVLSRVQQVLCVTHLPQIAAFADQHFVIEKRESQGRTKTQVRLLDERARVEEVARMLSGAVVTEASQQHASQMIEASR
jgi:DNA repair protein RecN (Recombination protein N)